jgi:hypothetical protein
VAGGEPGCGAGDGVVGHGGEYLGEVAELVDGVELAGYDCGRGMVMMVLETWILEFAIILRETK